jgi:hypothetical protein
MVFRREPCLPCDLLLRAPPDKEQSMPDYVMDLIDRLHDIHHYACQHLKMNNDRMKGCYDFFFSSVGFQEGDKSGCTTRPGKDESLINSSHLGQPIQSDYPD